jgi:hypothetical protein
MHLSSWEKAIWKAAEQNYLPLLEEVISGKGEVSFAMIEDYVTEKIGFQGDRMLFEVCARKYEIVDQNWGWERG